MAAEGTDDKEIVFLTVDQIIILHQDSIKRYSPTETFNVRDYGLLESAVMAPQQTFDGHYLYPTLVGMAAAYLIGLALNHAFENGNKRVAFATCSVFLRMNGHRLTLDNDEAVNLTLGIIEHNISREDAMEILGDALHAL